jgi:hypothetical protein
MNSPFEISLDYGFKKVCRTHRSTTSGEEDIGIFEAFGDNFVLVEYTAVGHQRDGGRT